MSDRSVSRRQHAPKGPIKPIETADPSKPRKRKWKTQCTAHSSRTGKRCEKPPIAGGTVCRTHGAAAPQVREAARQRYEALEHPAVDRMGKLIAQEEFPTVAFSASRDVLDRLWGKPIESVSVEHSGGIAIRWRRDDEQD